MKKNSEISQEVSFSLPVYMGFQDYHEVADMADLLSKLIGRALSYIEIGCDDRGKYQGVFFLPNQEEKVRKSAEFLEIKDSCF